MNLARVGRPVSVALAGVASALLLAGLPVPGLAVGVLAVFAAWAPPSPPPPQ